MMVSGAKVKRTEKDFITTIMEQYIKVVFLMAKRMVLGLLSLKTKLKLKPIGVQHMSRAQVRFFIVMEIIFKVTITSLKNKEKVCMFGKMLNIREDLVKILCKATQKLNFHRYNSTRGR